MAREDLSTIEVPLSRELQSAASVGVDHQPLTKRQAFADLCAEAGSRLAPCSLENWNLWGTPDEKSGQHLVKQKAVEFAEKIGLQIASGCNVVFIGTVGTGKDHMMMGLLREAIKADVTSIQWTTGARFFGSYRDGITCKIPEYETTDFWCGKRILVLSDLLAANEILTEWQQTQLWSVLDQRYRSRRPTWLSINVATREEAVAKIGEKILSRLQDPGFVVRFFWSDYRMRAK